MRQHWPIVLLLGILLACTVGGVSLWVTAPGARPVAPPVGAPPRVPAEFGPLMLELEPPESMPEPLRINDPLDDYLASAEFSRVILTPYWLTRWSNLS